MDDIQKGVEWEDVIKEIHKDAAVRRLSAIDCLQIWKAGLMPPINPFFQNNPMQQFNNSRMPEPQVVQDTTMCVICKKYRPDSKIVALDISLTLNKFEHGTQTIHYCKDNPKCKAAAEAFTIISS